MSANSYGIITEGEYDAAAYGAIVRKLVGHDVHVRMFPCRGKPQLFQKFPAYLEALKHEIAGGPVDMAVVIADADGRDPTELEKRMRSKVGSRSYPFPLEVRFYAVANAMETWLLADPSAISAVVESRSPRKSVTRTHDTPEQLLDPKPFLRRLLIENGVGYTQAVAADIARNLDLNVVSRTCPRFQQFAELVDC